MLNIPNRDGISFQSIFNQQWDQLRDPHVRALAGLLTAPDLLNKHAPQWQNNIASLFPLPEDTFAWLHDIDKQPEALHQAIAAHPSNRLGRYAEILLGFYFQHHHRLVAQNIQIREGAHHTVGEFDFLIQGMLGVEHWELATKFYLLVSTQYDMDLHSFLGPNLADSFGAKITKTLTHQLKLSEQAAAQAYLTYPISAAFSLMKGWLFYQDMTQVVPESLGIASSHCRGFWCSLSQIDALEADGFLVLKRLNWLAPAQCQASEVMTKAELKSLIAAQFALNPTPAMIALCRYDGAVMHEIHRGFVVSDAWYGDALAKIIATHTRN